MGDGQRGRERKIVSKKQGGEVKQTEKKEKKECEKNLKGKVYEIVWRDIGKFIEKSFSLITYFYCL